MTMFMCHCGEVHDSAVQGSCPIKMTLGVFDDWQSRVVEAAIVLLRTEEKFWCGMRDRDKSAFRSNLAARSNAFDALMLIVNEREPMPEQVRRLEGHRRRESKAKRSHSEGSGA